MTLVATNKFIKGPQGWFSEGNDYLGDPLSDTSLAEMGVNLAELPTGEASNRMWYIIAGVVCTASGAVSAYHGYKRNYNSVGWGLVWGLAGVAFPLVTPSIALLLKPGFARPKGY